MARNPVPDDLIRNTLQLASSERNGEPGDDQADGESGQSRGPGAGRTRSRVRRKLAAGERPRDCKLKVPQSIFDRLRQTAIKRNTTMSVVAAEILHRELKYFDVIQRDKPPAAAD